MSEWIYNFSDIKKDGKWWATALSKNEAKKIVEELDSYETRIAELGSELAQVRSQSLRVVPMDDPCDLDEIPPEVWLVSFHDNIYYREEDGYSWAAFSNAAKPRFLQSLSYVLPVELKSWSENNDDLG